MKVSVVLNPFSRASALTDILAGLTKDQLEEFLTTPIPTLHKSGLLDIFPPDEWIAGGSSAGRKFVGKKAKEQGY